MEVEVCENRIVIVISTFLKRYSKAKRTRAPAYSRTLRRIKWGSKGGIKRSSGPISRVPGGDRVAVRVGVVEMGRRNDQMGQGRSVWRDEILILSGRPWGWGIEEADEDDSRGGLENDDEGSTSRKWRWRKRQTEGFCRDGGGIQEAEDISNF